MEALQIVSKGEQSAEADADFLNLRDPERMGAEPLAPPLRLMGEVEMTG
jgi:hypothetical protein